MRAFAIPERRRLQRKSACRSAGPAPGLLGRERRRAVREILDGTEMRVVQNLDQEEVGRRAAGKRIDEREPGPEIEHPEGPEGHPARVPRPRMCQYRSITVSHRDAWQNYPASSGGGRAGGAFVSPNADWVAGVGSMKERFLLTIEVDGDPTLCRYQQENQNRVVRREGTPGEVVDRDRPRHDDTYPAGSSWIRFVGSMIQWMDAPGYAAGLDAADVPVHQQWTFWWSAWDSDGTGPLVLQLSYDFKADGPGLPWSITYDPGVPSSVSR